MNNGKSIRKKSSNGVDIQVDRELASVILINIIKYKI